MDEDTASRFVASLVKSIQALCNGYIEFSTSIEVIGHIHLNIDRNCKFNYVLSEEVNKSVSEGSTIFSSHSYHSHPPSSLVPVKASSSVESAKGTHRKSQSVPSVHQGDTAAVTSLQKEVTVSHKDTQKINDYTPQTSLSDRLSESGDSSHSGKFSLNLTYESSSAQSGRLPQTSSTGTPNSAHSKLTSHNQDPLDRRRKAQTEVQTRRTVEPSPKRTRANDSGLGTQDSGFEVIEIKEEPSLEEPCVFFADSNSQIPMGQGDLSSGASRLSDLNQTPDFSKSVMESLERVGQLEGASLINPVDAQIQLQQQPLQQDQPFPVMLHANSAAQASSVALPGTSNQQGSAPSTSGVLCGAQAKLSGTFSPDVGKQQADLGQIKVFRDIQFLPNHNLVEGRGYSFQNFRAQVFPHERKTFQMQRQWNDSILSEEERIAKRREQVRLRVRAHRARKKAAWEQAMNAMIGIHAERKPAEDRSVCE